MTEMLIFPVGHYMGTFYPKTNAPLKYHKIRLGVDVPQLPDEDHFKAWALTHGLPGDSGQGPWTRRSVLDEAKRLGLDADQVLAALADKGVVAEVESTGPGAVEFARRHRLQPLMMGLGNSPDDPLRFAIGLIGVPPAVKVDSFVFEIWQWGRLGRSLWETAEMFSKVEQEVGTGRRADASPEKMLTEILEHLHILLSQNAAYLDTTLEPATEEG
ncbi:MAG: hypothetical protein ACRDT8_18935 [Micromonosporaceae bacterium]